jgi:Activator of Hsp90 ATPase homolog 1-like protein
MEQVYQKESDMSNNYTTTFTVDQTPEEAFAAINNVRGWWSDDIEGSTDKPDAEFVFQSGDVHRSVQKISEFVPGKKVVWHVSDSQINFVADKAEWTGTDIVFEITHKDDKTELRFTHVGLVPAIECYGACSNAWGFYVNVSLRSLITHGKGQPDQKENRGERKDSAPIKLNLTQG